MIDYESEVTLTEGGEPGTPHMVPRPHRLQSVEPKAAESGEAEDRCPVYHHPTTPSDLSTRWVGEDPIRSPGPWTWFPKQHAYTYSHASPTFPVGTHRGSPEHTYRGLNIGRADGCLPPITYL